MIADKKYHMANLINPEGKVSALCYKNPRAINLGQAMWTTDEKAVTCKRCLLKMSRGNGSLPKR
jgi:hypothetical protein